MANYTGGVLSVCPFYQHEALFSITCEGPDGSRNIKVCFQTKEEKGNWQRAKCFIYDYELHCPVAMALLIHDDCKRAQRMLWQGRIPQGYDKHNV